MKKKENTPKTREEIFAEKADNYFVCFSEICPLREHCLRRILASYKPKDRIYITSVNLLNPQMQGENCPQFAKDEPVRIPFGLHTIYYDMPGRIERAIKNHLIHVYSRKRYCEYHNGTRPMKPDVERYVRQVIKSYGRTQDPQFGGYVEELAAPGMKKEDFNVHINDEGNLIIKMESKNEKKEEDKNTRYLRREFSYSKFEQTLILPDDVKKEEISAKVEHGVLTVELPKLVEEKVKLSRQIDIA